MELTDSRRPGTLCPKISFLSSWLGENTYNEFKEMAPVVVGIGSCVLGVLFALSQYFHWGWVSSLLNMATGYSLLFIVYLLGIMLLLDIEVKMDAVYYKDWLEEKHVRYEKPTRYAFTVAWNIVLILAGIAAMYYSNQYKKEYSFECSTVGIEEGRDTYHLFKDCDNIHGNVYKVKGYEAKEKGAQLCRTCKSIEEDYDVDEPYVRMRPH